MVSSQQDTFTPGVQPFRLQTLQTRCRVPFASAAVLEMGLGLQPASSRKSPGGSNLSHSWMMEAIVLTEIFKATKPFLYIPVLEVSRQFLLLPSCLAGVLRCTVCLPKPCPMNSVYLRSPMMLQEHLMDDQRKHLRASCQRLWKLPYI